ncbi:MAG: hypothetical protein EOP84_20665 [Verrucomicrobiaceae bacterium]|nr:MAG: hypothetical protein EOP84_20665 [Verrucomicrobiaceae bacterium]
MSNEHKPQQKETPHMEKQVFPEPMEEFIADQSVPSKSMKAERSESSSSPQRAHDVKPAGHQEGKAENFEPGVEG